MPSARLPDRAVIGLLLVALGIMFLLDTTNALGPGTNVVGTYWPVLLIAWGVIGLVANGLALRLWMVVVLVVGVIFLLSNLKLWSWDAGQLWPVILVVVGLAFLFGGAPYVEAEAAGGAGEAETLPRVDALITGGQRWLLRLGKPVPALALLQSSVRPTSLAAGGSR